MTIHYRIKNILKKPKIQSAISKLEKIKLFSVKVFKIFIEISTVAASIATCVTVLQMRNERNQSYKPFFVFKSLEYADEYTKPVYDIWDSRNYSDSLNVDVEKRPQMYLIIENIGAGTAVNINITFPGYIYEEYLEIACEYYGEKKYRSQYGYTRDFNVYKTHIVSGENMEIELPEEYQKAFRSIAYCTWGDCYRPSVMDITIDYDDLQGIHYSETYNIGVDIEVDMHSSETMDYAKYIFKQCKPNLNMEDYYAGFE